MNELRYPGQVELQHRIRRACLDESAKPVAFMLGAGAAAGSVPTTSEMVTFFEKSLASDPEDAAAFEEAVRGLPSQKQYQAGAQFLIERAGLGHLNRVIRGAVLRSRSPRIDPEIARKYLKDEERLRELEADYLGWAVPRGISAIAKILAIIPAAARGPILTTNFDPLIEVSVRAANLEPYTIISDSDGSVQTPSGVGTVVPIVHLHGFWRMSDTLHTSIQLRSDRPKLLGSLRQILSSSTLIVLGYGGWDDILTSAILQVVREGGQRDLEVLWACHGATMSMGAVSDADLPGRIQPYTSVDCNQLVPDVLTGIQSRQKTVRTVAAPPRRQAPKLAGCTTISDEFLDIYRSQIQDPKTALSYFDGRDPSWLDVLAGRAPIRAIVGNIVDSLGSPSSKQVILLEGPTGEGKSTILRQIAMTCASNEQNLVFWADHPGTRVDVEQLFEMTATRKRMILLMDDADLRIDDIRAVYTRAKTQRRRDITLVLASRDTDWQRSSTRFGLALPTADLDRHLVSGLTEEDALRIVSAWADFGAAGLGRLTETSSSAERAHRLYSASLDAGNSALLGAMLATRYGTGFRDHIRELLARLQRVQLPGGGTLLDAYMMICTRSALGLEPVNINHLSLFANLSVQETQSLIVTRLGREAAAERHGDQVIPRHSRIAAVAYEMAGEFELDVGDIQARLIASVVQKERGQKWSADTLSVVYSGQRIEEESLAIRAVDAASAADSTQLRLVCSQLGVYRKFLRLAEASKLCDSTWNMYDGLIDVRIAFRPFLREWARVEGMQDRWETSAALNACALLDLPGVDDLDFDNACRAMSGLALSLQRSEIDDSDKSVKWVGVLAEEALDVVVESTLRGQAERTLGRATREGYVSEPLANRVQVVREAVKFAIRMTPIGPAIRFRRFSSSLDSLERLV